MPAVASLLMSSVYLMTFWFWFTPIFYAAERFPARLHFLLRLNPLAYVVVGYRDCLLRMKMPDLKAKVFFPNAGEKNLLLKFAKLRISDQVE